MDVTNPLHWWLIGVLNGVAVALAAVGVGLSTAAALGRRRDRRRAEKGDD